MNNELRCPKCNGDKIELDGTPNIEDNISYQDCICSECEFQFYATFIFESVNQY